MGVSTGGFQPGSLNAEGFHRTLYVGTSTLYTNGQDGRDPKRPLATIKAALDSAKVDPSDRGTLIVVRRGHTESISTADYFTAIGSKKRVTIRGEGDETERPTLTWTTATSTWLIQTASIVIENMNLNLDGGTTATNTAAAITITGAGCGFRNCKIRGGTDASNLVTVGIIVNAADCFMENVTYYAATAAEATTHIRLVAATRFRAWGLRVTAATSSTTVGVVQCLTTASTDLDFRDCYFRNNKAASIQALTGLAACTGHMRECHFAILDNATLAAVGTPASISFFQCFVSNDLGETGAIKTTVSA